MPAAFAIILAGWAPTASAQESSSLLSPVARVQLVAVMLPRVEPIAPALSPGIAWSGSAGTGLATIPVAVNARYRIVVHRFAQSTPAPAPARIWVRADDGRLHELGEAEPIVVRRARTTAGYLRVPFVMSAPPDGTSAVEPPLRFDIVVEPTL
jgi:hypothetical protein